jgi:hypothetical protein
MEAISAVSFLFGLDRDAREAVVEAASAPVKSWKPTIRDDEESAIVADKAGDDDDDDQTPFSSVERKKGEKKKKATVCRSTLLGTVCKEVGCGRAHIPQCKLTTCRPKRDPNCSDWHAVASSTASKNGRGGRGPPSKKNGPRNSGSNNHHNNNKGNLVLQSMTVRAKLAELRFENLRLKQAKPKPRHNPSQQRPASFAAAVGQSPAQLSVAATPPVVTPVLPGDFKDIIAAMLQQQSQFGVQLEALAKRLLV